MVLNAGALSSPKLTVVNEDAFAWMKANGRAFDFIGADFPDPSNFSLGKLYSDAFYREMRRALKPDGMGVVQSTSSYFAPRAYWCIEATLRSVGFSTLPYHLYPPSFGDWGFVMFAHGPLPGERRWPEVATRYIEEEAFRSMLVFPKDMGPRESPRNTLDEQVLVRLFEEEWSGVAAR